MILYFVIAAALCLADQLFKLWVTANIDVGGYVKLLPGIISLTNVKNTGAAFSLFANSTAVLAFVSVAASAAIAAVIIKSELPKSEKLFLAIVLGGALGNAADRLFRGYVPDMFRLEFVNFAVFNLADAFINVGVFGFAALYIIRSAREERRRKQSGGTEK